MRSLVVPALLAALALGACTEAGGRGPITVVSAYRPITVPAVPPPWPFTAEGPRLALELRSPPEEAVPLVREVAARCWLPVLQAETLVLDPDGPVIVLTGAAAPVLAVEFLPTVGLAQIRMTGATMYNPDKVEELLRFLTRAERTGEVDCPPVPT